MAGSVSLEKQGALKAQTISEKTHDFSMLELQLPSWKLDRFSWQSKRLSIASNVSGITLSTLTKIETREEPSQRENTPDPNLVRAEANSGLYKLQYLFIAYLADLFVSSQVTWNAADDPDNPKKWPKKRKWINLIVVSLYCFIAPLGSTILAASLVQIQRDLHVTNDVELQAIFSVFTLGFMIGPIFMSPFSDIYGRVIVLHASNVLFLVANTCCIAAQSGTALIILRLIAGIGGSAALTIGGGMIGEMFEAEERGAAVALYSVAPIAGPTLGPILGAFLSKNLGLASMFEVTSIASVLLGIAGFVFLRETNPRIILGKRAERLRKQTGNLHLRTQFEATGQMLQQALLIAMRRPFRLLFTQPMAALLVVFQSYLWGLLYLAFSIYISIFTGAYGQDIDTASLNFLAFFFGSIISTYASGMISDRVYRGLKSRYGGVGKPIFRLPMTVAGVFSFATGLIIIGWAAQQRLPFIVADIGGAMFALGAVMAYQSLQALMIDAYAMYATAMLAAAAMVRSTASFVFPLFGPALFKSLGFGWGHTLIALIALFLGSATVVAIWRVGDRLRAQLPADF